MLLVGGDKLQSWWLFTSKSYDEDDEYHPAFITSSDWDYETVLLEDFYDHPNMKRGSALSIERVSGCWRLICFSKRNVHSGRSGSCFEHIISKCQPPPPISSPSYFLIIDVCNQRLYCGLYWTFAWANVFWVSTHLKDQHHDRYLEDKSVFFPWPPLRLTIRRKEKKVDLLS